MRALLELRFYLANSTTPATNMAAPIVSQWLRAVPGEVVSLQMTHAGAVVGAWSVESTNDLEPVDGIDGTVSTFPEDGYNAPTQPGGQGDTGETSIAFEATHTYHRAKFTPTSGGASAVPSGMADTPRP